MSFFALFRKHQGHQYRLDTRIYLRDEMPGEQDVCVAAIIGKNPGSANGSSFDVLAPISLDGDKLLPYVRNRFHSAYKRAGVAIPSGAYVRVWNLFYLCNKSLKEAVKTHSGLQNPLCCDTEAVMPPIVWFAWGPPEKWHKQLSARFLMHQVLHPFYFDMDSEQVVPTVPSLGSRVKHTQGLPAEPIETHLALLLTSHTTHGPKRAV